MSLKQKIGMGAVGLVAMLSSGCAPKHLESPSFEEPSLTSYVESGVGGEYHARVEKTALANLNIYQDIFAQLLVMDMDEIPNNWLTFFYNGQSRDSDIGGICFSIQYREDRAIIRIEEDLFESRNLLMITGTSTPQDNGIEIESAEFYFSEYGINEGTLVGQPTYVFYEKHKGVVRKSMKRSRDHHRDRVTAMSEFPNVLQSLVHTLSYFEEGTYRINGEGETGYGTNLRLELIDSISGE
jgi:hypothetical protein